MVLEEGAQIVADPKQPIPMTMIGHVTSSYWSENCGRSIALALVAGGRARMGETLYVPMPDGTIEVEVCRHGVLRREGRPPQWLRPRRSPPPSARRSSPDGSSRADGVKLAVLRAGASPRAARAGEVGRRAVEGARPDAADDAEELGHQGQPHRAVARAGRMAGHRRGGERSARRLRRGQGAAFGGRRLAPQRRASRSPARAPQRRVNAGCPQDLSLAAFPVGACSRTILGKVEIVLLRTAEDSFPRRVLALVLRLRLDLPDRSGDRRSLTRNLRSTPALRS